MRIWEAFFVIMICVLPSTSQACEGWAQCYLGKTYINDFMNIGVDCEPTYYAIPPVCVVKNNAANDKMEAAVAQRCNKAYPACKNKCTAVLKCKVF